MIHVHLFEIFSICVLSIEPMGILSKSIKRNFIQKYENKIL